MRVILAGLLVALAMAAPARAQEPISRADSAEVLVGTAERLRAQGADELADALARLVQRRYADTPAAARAGVLLTASATPRDSRGGRVGTIAFTTLYGSWLGIAVPIMFEAESPEAFGIGLLTGAPAGFYAGRLYTRGRSVSAGDAGVISWGGLWGTWQGVGWLLALDDDELTCAGDVCTGSETEGSDVVGASVLGGLLGMSAGMVAAHRADIGGGTATMIGWGSLWGTSAGLVTVVLFDLSGEDEPLLAALIGGDIGLASMAVLAPRWNVSTGRAWLINAGGVMGGAIGGGIDLLIQPESEDVAVLIPAVGAAVGLWLGAHLTRDMDEGRVREGRLDPRDASDALVRRQAGAWRIGVPQPSPALLGSGRTREMGVRLQLLDARF